MLEATSSSVEPDPLCWSILTTRSWSQADVILAVREPASQLRHVCCTPRSEAGRQGMADEEFSAFYAATYQRLLGQLVLLCGDRAEAEDALQEAFARAAVRWHRLRSYQAPEAWVRRVALNLTRMAARRLRRRTAALVRLGSAPAAAELSAETIDLLVALRALPVAQRQVLVLHHLMGLPVAEVARELGLPVGTVKTRLARGRRALAVRLALDSEEVPRHG